MKIIYKSRLGAIFSIVIMLVMLLEATIIIGDPFDETVVKIDPENQTVGPSENFDISVYCEPGQPIKAFEFKLSFNASLISANEVTEGDIFTGYTTFFNAGTIDNSAGTIVNVYGLIMGPGNVSSPGILVNISFTAKTSSGTSILGIYDVGVTNETDYVPISITNGTVLVDMIAPEITDNSPSQGFTGDSFLFNASVTDNANSADELIVKVDWSHGEVSGNDSMIHVGGNCFEKTVILDINSVQDMTYSIYACDSFGNSITTSLKSVSVFDNDPPTISDVSASPSSQEVFGFVNISAVVTDNIAMDMVYLNISYPDSSSENISITVNKTGDTYFCNKTYDMIGQYLYFIWANDAEANSDFSSSYTFVIGDMTAPEISNVVLIPSDPLDTDPTFGWVNVTCEVTDNVAIDSVYLNIKNPDGSWNNVSLSTSDGVIYYYNSSIAFSESGNYTYHIWAEDASNNSVVSGSYNFSMAPNWDIDNNGVINIFDMVLVSNHYDEDGNAGWIREDVDNNGEVQVLDLVQISNHYGEIWWEE